MRFALILMAVFAAPFALAQEVPPRAPAPEASPRIVVTGEGRVAAAPDMATLRLGVTSLERTAEAAMATTSAAAADVLEALRAAGVADRDLQTQGLSLRPQYGEAETTQPGQGPRVTGFVAENLLVVRIRALDQLGAVLDSVTGSGANRLEGLSFGLTEPEPVRDEARRRAVAEARRKAALYAEAAGVELGALQTLSESGTGPQPPTRIEATAMARDAVPVAEGELEVTAEVTMVFAIAGEG